MDHCEILICTKYSVLDNKGWVATVSILTPLFLLFIAFQYITYRRNLRRYRRDIQQLKKELAGKERDKKELEEKLAHTEQGKLVYQDILVFEIIEEELYFDNLSFFGVTSSIILLLISETESVDEVLTKQFCYQNTLLFLAEVII